MSLLRANGHSRNTGHISMTRDDARLCEHSASKGSDGSEPSVGEPLTWYPKRFGPGDVHGMGALKLLGNPDIPLPSLIVREAAQNSWDARLTQVMPSFAIDLRKLTDRQRNHLVGRVFVEGSDRLPLGKSLSKSELRVLEIHDRGTTGLDGPVRNDYPVRIGESTNFMDLILNVGVPPTNAVGGGTYGFGKMASYMATHSGTVVFWTRVKTAAGFESRLIASGVGGAFDIDGGRYTGRHWWGVPSEDRETVLPLQGSQADQLGAMLFSRDFETLETGTSMMLIDPKLPEVQGNVLADQFMNEIEKAVLANLWPKLVGSDDQRRMTVSLSLDGVPVPVRDPQKVSFLAPFVRCLEEVRSSQQGVAQSAMTARPEIFTLRSKRPARELGQLALTRAWITPDAEDLGVGKESHHVCLMRSGAEHVVKYMELPRNEVDGFQWAAVFKPHPDLDSDFARAEPPAHDDWISAQLEPPAKTYVNVAYREIKLRVEGFLQPDFDTAGGDGAKQSVAKLADRLSLFVAGVPGAAPLTRRAGSHTRRSTVRREKPRITDSRILSEEGEVRFSAVKVESVGPLSSGSGVSVTALIVQESGPFLDPGLAKFVGWMASPQSPFEFVEDGGDLLRSGGEAWAVIRSRRDVVVDVQASWTER